MSRKRNKKKAPRAQDHLGQRDESVEQRRDILHHTIQLRAATADDEHRTVEAVVTSEQPVIVMDRRTYELIEEVLLCDGCELPERAPLLESHDRWNIDAVLGSVRQFKREPGAISAQLQFMKGDERSERIWPKVREGHLDSVSIGYRVGTDGYVDIAPGKTHSVNGRSFTAKDLTLRVATKWEIHEVSMVVIPADSTAKVREEEIHKSSECKGNKTMNEKVRKFLESLGLRADAGDEIAQAFLEGLGGEQRARADAIDEGREAWPPAAAAPAPTVTPEPTRAAGDPVDLDSVRAAAVREAQEADKARVASIRTMAGDSVDRALVDKAIDKGWSEEQASRAFLAHVADKVEPGVGQTGPGIRVFDGGVSQEAITDSLILRAGAFAEPGEHVSNEARFALEKRHELASREGRRSLMDIARDAILLDGRDIPRDQKELFERAFSGGALSNIFTTSANVVLLQSYALFDDSTRGWTSERDLPNYLQHDAISGHGVGPLRPLGSGGKAKDMDLGDEKESYRPFRYAGNLTIDEMDLINDAVHLLITSPKEMGIAAAQLRPESVLYVLLSNPALDVDSTAIFHADHSNLATTGSALAEATLQAGLIALANQTDQRGRVLNLKATHLLVPADLDFTADQLLNSTSRLGTSGFDKNTFKGRGIMSVPDARLGVAGVTDPLTETSQAGTATNWFLVDGSGKTIEVGFVTGREPQLRPYVLDKGRYGIGWDINHSIGVKGLGYRALYKATGEAA